MSASFKLPVRMLVADFLVWEPGDGLTYELVDGEPRGMAPTSTVHGFLQSELGSLIRNHLHGRGSPCRVIANPGIIPRLLSAHNVRVPDLGVTCVPLLPGQATPPEPVLLIEIVSPSNQAKTWSNVWAYTSIPSVREILVLHAGRIEAEILSRDDAGGWPQEPRRAVDGDLALDSIGFRVQMADLYAATGLPGLGGGENR
jgi:Uma2 family endonuclease